MSISKYHVSKNLFDESTLENGKGINTAGTIISQDGRIASSTPADVTSINGVTVSYTGSATIIYALFDSTNTLVARSAGIRSGDSIDTSGGTKLYLCFYRSGESITTSDVSQIMVNNGTTPEPYEPYSSEVWHTIPYKKYETATDTITSLPKTIIGDGQPISSYTIKGNMTQSGTPTPSNPVYPTECGEKTANLFDKTSATTYNAYFNTSGVLTSSESSKVVIIPVEANTTYTITVSEKPTVMRLYETSVQSPNIGTVFDVITREVSSNTMTFTTGADTVNLGLQGSLNTYDTWFNSIMLVKGAMPLPYEPYGLYKIPILSNGVSYPVYLAEPIRKISTYADECPSTGTATRNIYKLVLTGSETGWRSSADVYFNQEITPDYLRAPNKNTLLCTHYQSINQVSSASAVGDGQCSLYNTSGSQRLYFRDSSISSLDDFKQFLADQYAAGTPVTVWYVLATAQTESFTAPTIPTSGSPQTFDVDTTLKPSEVSLTYHGWHEHSDTKYSNP